jgi:hypothetical protein
MLENPVNSELIGTTFSEGRLPTKTKSPPVSQRALRETNAL